jgi:hypothetical protein
MFRIIADILSYSSCNKTLELKLTSTSFNWDKFVQVSSKQLILITVFCRLRDKQLLHTLPEELKNYLEDLSLINRNRNLALLKQSREIATLLEQENIAHVFVKGIAMLNSNQYNDIAERLIGDIDILVDRSQTKQAHDLLIKQKYNPSTQTFETKYFEQKHLPRLISQHHIGAVELHTHLIKKVKTPFVEPQDVLLKKEFRNNLWVPSNQLLLDHNILNYQINDKGSYHGTINFRSIFDTITLINNDKTLVTHTEERYYKNYYNLASIFFKELSSSGYRSFKLKQAFYLFRQKSATNNKVVMVTLNFITQCRLYYNRAYLFIFNKAYRKDIYKDRNRIIKRLKSMLGRKTSP